MELKDGAVQTELNTVSKRWRHCDISELCELQRGFDLTEATRKPGTVPVYSSSGLAYFHNEAKLEPPSVLTGRKGLLGKVFFVEEPCWPHDTTLWVKNFKGNDPRFIAIFLSQFRLERFDAATSVPTLNRNNLVGYPIRLPCLSEQRTIAVALSDVDALLGGLDRLIAKKRHVKQAAMQQLLTGQTRLPGFDGEWEAKRLGEICDMKSGEGITSASIHDFSAYPCYGGNGLRGYTSRFTHNGSFALIGRQGALCGNVVGVEGRFFASEHAVVVTPFSRTDIRWLTYVLATMNLNQYSESSAQPGLSVSKVLMLDVSVPPSKAEQTAIAAVLSDMDSELSALEARRDKTRALKQAMMQELLTGRTRLV